MIKRKSTKKKLLIISVFEIIGKSHIGGKKGHSVYVVPYCDRICHDSCNIFGFLKRLYLKFDLQNMFCISDQCGTNIRIFEYIQIYLDKYIHSSKYSSIFSKANIFGYSFVIYLCWYSNTFEYFGQIYSFAKIFVDFFIGEFIRIFIRDIFIMPNIFGYSFVQYLW